ncbi:mitogen-activated protein kinase kinase kinase 2-like isoform X2 [Actinia tenebrosa]|uniref:Mitogen-activated protein kinase kinase kinase 2-like isoform X2 n=1 Tax=Actinia tenebrosa TaxID=6105 RepID=A0A6P8HMI0_ACTTE|nr:mitogen-activated protein kinase kinase kinase 2-like isoform X2 [Actinia tenebrosa]
MERSCKIIGKNQNNNPSTDDVSDMESGYISPEGDNTLTPQSFSLPNSSGFISPPPKNDIRVKFEFQGERRIIPVSRPVILADLLQKVKTAYGQELCMNYINEEITIPVVTQSDLEKAIEILDRSPHLTSLRVYLSLPNGVLNKTRTAHSRRMMVEALIPAPPNPKMGSLFGRSLGRKSRAKPTSYGLGSRSQSTPDEIANMVEDTPSTPTLSCYHPIQYMSTNDIRTKGRDSPPPGFHPESAAYVPRRPYHFIRSEGEFIPETCSSSSEMVQGHIRMFDPLSHSEVRVVSSPSSEGSLTGSSSSLNGTFSVGSVGEVYSSFSRMARRTHSNNSLNSGGMFSSEEDMLDGKADTFPRRRQTFSGSISDISDGHQTFPRFQSLTSRKPIPASMRSDMSSQHSLASTSSSSSGMMADIEGGYRRPRRESEPGLHSSNIMPATQFPNNWRKGKLLGAGAFGQVYMCHDLDTGRELAVKQIETGLLNSSTKNEVRALEGEIGFMKNFRHERIVQYYGMETTDLHIYIFMEYMPGSSVHEHIKQHGALNESLARRYTRQILEGVCYLHSNRIVHRDIKGANILRDLHGNVKLADFGASKRLQTIRSKTGFRSVHGTPYWMAPEVINGEGYGRKADVWSIGCTVVEMLTTKPPWAEFEPMAALFKIATQNTEPDLPPESSQDAVEFVRNIFTKDSKSRPSADDLFHFSFVFNSSVSTCL